MLCFPPLHVTGWIKIFDHRYSKTIFDIYVSVFQRLYHQPLWPSVVSLFYNYSLFLFSLTEITHIYG